MNEKQIEKDILTYLEYSSHGLFWKNRTEGISRGRTRVKQSEKNLYRADILGLGLDGQFIAIEVKDPKEYAYIMKHYTRIREGDFSASNTKLKRYQGQLLWIEEINCRNGKAFFAESVERVELMLGNSIPGI